MTAPDPRPAAHDVDQAIERLREAAVMAKRSAAGEVAGDPWNCWIEDYREAVQDPDVVLALLAELDRPRDLAAATVVVECSDPEHQRLAEAEAENERLTRLLAEASALSKDSLALIDHQAATIQAARDGLAGILAAQEAFGRLSTLAEDPS